MLTLTQRHDVARRFLLAQRAVPKRYVNGERAPVYVEVVGDTIKVSAYVNDDTCAKVRADGVIVLWSSEHGQPD